MTGYVKTKEMLIGTLHQVTSANGVSMQGRATGFDGDKMLIEGGFGTLRMGPEYWEPVLSGMKILRCTLPAKEHCK